MGKSSVAAAALALVATAYAGPAPLGKRASLDVFIASERDIAVAGVLANIGPNGALATNASRGVVIAGPGIVNPDYRYSWTRDSALTLHAIDEEFFVGNASLQNTIEDYIYAEANRQTVYDAMGPLYPWGTGLGEPKYQINLTRFNGVWGRPQRDGPALRAITLMVYINYLLNHNQYDHAKNVVWPVVSNDLSYVAQYWNETGYDLWEEVAGSSFFTIQSQHRALVQGSQTAARLGESCPNCDSQAPQLACFLASPAFWNATGNHIISNINTPAGFDRTGIDADYLLGSIENFDIDGSCDNAGYQPCSSRILASHKVYVDSFRTIYPINNGTPANAAIATGRYPEDTYYGGNPWYLCTLSAAETLYDAAAQFRRQGQLTIDAVSLDFFKQIYPSAAVGVYKAPQQYGPGGRHWNNYGMSQYGEGSWGCPSDFGNRHGPGGYGPPGYGPGGQQSSAFNDILKAMTDYADGFIAVVEKYTPTNGSLSEQYNRTSGEQLSAWDLTWSFASFVTAAQRRAGQFPPSWNSRNAAATPATCSASSAQGTYAAATAAGAPPVSTACTVQVTFVVNASTTFGQNVYISGNVSALGDWAPGYEPMVPPNYPLWYSIVDVAPETTISYKYVHQNSASYAFEIQNRTVYTGPCGNGFRQIQTNDVFSGEGTVVTENFCNPDVNHCW